MKAFETKIDTNAEEFRTNADFMTGLVGKVKYVENQIRVGEEKYRARAIQKGKLLPRERLALLLDHGAPFLELCPIAGYKMFGDTDGTSAGGNIITGIGYVSGRRVLVIVNNFAIKGGTINSVTFRKTLRLQEIAFKMRLPVVSLSESGGGNLADRTPDPWGAHSFIDSGLVYCQQAELSAAGIPQITVAHGNATAGGAYQVALSDYIVLVRGQSQIFLAGPPLLKAATGEEASAEELGGAEMHATITGTGEYLAEDDADGIRIAREIVDQLPRDAGEYLMADKKPEMPVYPKEDLLGIVPTDKKIPFDMREVIARIVDGSRFLEFKTEFGADTLCGHAYIEGQKCGIIANNSPITPQGAIKATQFLQLCDQSDTAMIFLHNTTGFLVGVEAEQFGQVKHGSKMIQAVANFRPPKISLIIGSSNGAGNYAMCSKALKPAFSFAWPTARMAVMGGEQATKVMMNIKEMQAERKGVKITDEERIELDQIAEENKAAFERISAPLFFASRMMTDGLIDPRDSRNVIAFCLATCRETPHRGTKSNTFGVARI